MSIVNSSPSNHGSPPGHSSVFQPRHAPVRAVFLGAAMHSSLGETVDQCLLSLRQPPRAASLHTTTISGETLAIPYKLLANVPLTNLEQRLHEVVSRVAEDAIAGAGLSSIQRAQLGVFVGSSSFDVSVSEAQFQRELSVGDKAVALREPSFGRLADSLIRRLGIRGPDYSVNTACTASANALVAAVTQVEAGLLDYALVLGVELYNDITALGFHGLGLLTQSVMKPFDKARDGLVLGEGVSALVVGRDPGDGQRRFFLRGSASLCDTYSISAAAPDGSSIRLVMDKALQAARLSVDAVAVIKAHGTASLSNDEAESAGMHQLFSQLPPVCALKPHLGHTLGACGLNELILFYRAAEAGFLVASPGISADTGDLNVCLNQDYSPPGHGNFMLNYFGFGGNNCSLILSDSVEPAA